MRVTADRLSDLNGRDDPPPSWRRGREVWDRRFLKWSEPCQSLMVQTDFPLFGNMRPNLFAEGVRQVGEMERLIRSHPSCVLVTYINERFSAKKSRGKINRRMNREELNRFFAAASQAVRFQNPDRVIKPVDAAAHEPLKRAPSVVELLAWCHFNGLVSRNTVFALHGEDTALSPRELLAILDSMERLFPARRIQSLPMKDLAHSPHVVALGSYLNVGLDPLANYTRRGQHLTSERTDALKYGGLSENLALSIDQVVLTSWHEVLTYRYVGVSGLFDCLADMMRWAPPSSGHMPPPLTAFSYSSTRGQAIAGRVEQLFADVMHAFYENRATRAPRYLVGVERHYYLLWLSGDTLNYEHLSDYEALLRYLGQPQPSFSRIVVDPQALENDVLSLLLEGNQPNVVQVYCEPGETGSKVWILDEKGSLFCDSSSEQDADSVLAHYEHFLESAHKRMSFASASAPLQVLFHRIEKLSDGKRHIYQHSLTNHVRPSHHFDVQVIGRPASNTSPLRIYCDGEEFSSLQYGERIYEAVAHHVLTRRRSGEDYPVYVSDVDAPPAASGDDASLQTIDYLRYKQRIEQHLRRAIG